jgi:hypothetical protein
MTEQSLNTRGMTDELTNSCLIHKEFSIHKTIIKLHISWTLCQAESCFAMISLQDHPALSKMSCYLAMEPMSFDIALIST